MRVQVCGSSNLKYYLAQSKKLGGGGRDISYCWPCIVIHDTYSIVSPASC